MTIAEMISKYMISLHGTDQLAVPGGSKLSKKTQAELIAAKPEIVAELKRRQEAYEARQAAEEAAKEEEAQSIMSGEKLITLHYHDGEYLSDWEAVGVAAELLQELGLVKWIDGWGYALIERARGLGHEFPYRAADGLAADIEAEKAAKEAEKEAAKQEKIAEAIRTGESVLLRKWTTGCCDRREECDMDMHYEYADPDGTVRHEWSHTW